MLKLSLKNLLKVSNNNKGFINRVLIKNFISKYNLFLFNNLLNYYTLSFNIYLFFNSIYKLKSKRLLDKDKNFVSLFTVLDKNSSLWKGDIRLKDELELVLGPFKENSALLTAQQLRNILLSNLGSYRISKVKIQHNDLASLNSLDLNFSEVLTNLSNVVFSIPFNNKDLMVVDIASFKILCSIKFKGPGIITASNIFDLPDTVKILNKNHFLCLSSHPVNLDLKLDLTYDTDSIKEKTSENIVFDKINNEYLISLSPNYNPILMVNFEIEQQYWLEPITNKYQKSDFIKLKIKTNGSISALESLYYSCCLYFSSLKL